MQSKIATSQPLKWFSLFPLNVKSILVSVSGICIVSMFCLTNSAKKEIAETNTNIVHPPAANKNSGTAVLPAGNQKTQAVNDVVTDALTFYNMLSASDQSTLQLTYTTALARKWSNLPCGLSCRNGLQLGTNLTTAQYEASMQIIKDALSNISNDGSDEYHQMNLAEAFLHANGGGNGYDSTLRWMAFLNTPTTTGSWMLQFGGHHYAANIAFNNGHVVGATPFFMGLEPKTFTYNGIAYDPLGEERNALANMLSSLSSAELSSAVITNAFSDCVMIPGETNGGAANYPAIAIGQPCSSLTATQQNLVLDVIRHYVQDMDTATANAVMSVYESEITSMYVSYHGSGTSGNAASFLVAQGDYGRISGPTVWIEFSCQGGVVIHNQIHYHTVWRDRNHDYGVDLTGAPIDVATETGISEMKIINSLNIYPNPSKEQISVKFNKIISNATVNIIKSETGQVVKTLENFSGENFNSNISGLSSGNYVLKIIDDHRSVYSGKFIKE